MDRAEQTEMLERWNATARTYPERNIAELFEEEAARRPEALALVFGAEQVSYGDLNRRANRLAHRLRERGVRPDTPVGLCLDRSVEMIVALLAILKAGGAYVALDPGYRRERLALMLENAEIPLLITLESLRDRLPKYPGRFVYLEKEQLDSEADANPNSGAGLDHLAYISYTSGSTGVPKGVAIPHRGVVRLVKAGGFARMDESQTFLQMAPVGFDASTFEIWGALLNGGRLVVMPPQTPSLEEIGLALRENGVTTLWLTAGLFHLMVDERLDDLRGLQQLLAGGDVLSPAHVRRAVEALPDCKIINGYGPTENTTFTCCHTISPEDSREGAIPLGRPIGNTRVYILDEAMMPVGAGAVGELYIGGDGLAREYWRQPQLTAAHFVPDPFGKASGARLYKSGDLVRWREDGVIQFEGRVDDQVKVSGYRIEPGEIETALRRHESVRDAAVLVRHRPNGSKDFIAYIIPAVTSCAAAEDLREFLRQTLPDAAIPIEYVEMEKFPLTGNGKVDRRALSGVSRPLTASFSPPQTLLERSIASVWREVIGDNGEIGVTENFFDLGGNSLRVIELHARLERALRRSFPLTALFQYPTIRTMSAFLDTKGPLGTDFAGISERARRQRVARAQRQEVRTRK
jgi:amino acid adenylation domain-containing protein